MGQSCAMRPDDGYRHLVKSVRDYAIFMLDPDGHIISWNTGAERIKGYREDEIVGKHFSTFYPPEDIAARKPQRELEQAIAVGSIEDEGWRVRKDGTRMWAHVVIDPLYDDSAMKSSRRILGSKRYVRSGAPDGSTLSLLISLCRE